MQPAKVLVFLIFTGCFGVFSSSAAEQRADVQPLSLDDFLTLADDKGQCRPMAATFDAVYIQCPRTIIDSNESGASFYRVDRPDDSLLQVIPITDPPPLCSCLPPKLDCWLRNRPLRFGCQQVKPFCQYTQTGVERTIILRTVAPSEFGGTWDILLKENSAAQTITFSKKSQQKSDAIVIGHAQGRYIQEINRATNWLRLADKRWYCFFSYDANYRQASYAKGASIFIVDREMAAIYPIAGSFSLSTPPIQTQRHIFYVGDDGGVYSYSLDDNTPQAERTTLLWQNDSGDEVKALGISSQVSFVKLRQQTATGAREFYRFFRRNNFSDPLITDETIEHVEFLPPIVLKAGSLDSADESARLSSTMPLINILSRDDIPASASDILTMEDSVALVRRGHHGQFLTETVIQRWLPDSSARPLEFHHLSSQHYGSWEAISRSKLQGNFAAPYSQIIVNSEEGTNIPTHIWPAAGASAKMPQPLIVYLHGGPDLYEDIGFSSGKQYWASQGFWVVCPELRGATGYGEEHYRARIGRWGEVDLSDLIAVIDYFEADRRVDSSKILIVGFSAGGHTALMASVDPRFEGRVQTIVSIAGIANVGKAFLESAQIDPFPADYLEARSAQVGFSIDEDSPSNLAISPIHKLEGLHPIILLIHGSEDKVVLPNQSQDFYIRANEAGKGHQVYFVEVVGEDHHFMSKYGLISYWHTPLQFFKKAITDDLPEGTHYIVTDKVEARQVFESICGLPYEF